MIRDSETEFDALVRSLVVSPDEAARQDALKERIKARVAPLFGENDTSKTTTNFARGSAKHIVNIGPFVVDMPRGGGKYSDTMRGRRNPRINGRKHWDGHVRERKL